MSDCTVVFNQKMEWREASKMFFKLFNYEVFVEIDRVLVVDRLFDCISYEDTIEAWMHCIHVVISRVPSGTAG